MRELCRWEVEGIVDGVTPSQDSCQAAEHYLRPANNKTGAFPAAIVAPNLGILSQTMIFPKP